MNQQTFSKFTARKAFANGIRLDAQEKEIRKELEAGTKVTYTYQGKKFTLSIPQTKGDMSRLQNVIALTTSEKTRIAITSMFRSLCGEGNTFIIDGTEYTCSRMGYIDGTRKVK